MSDLLRLAERLDVAAIKYANDYGYCVAGDLRKAAEVVRQAGHPVADGVEGLRKQAFELSRDDQYRLAFFIAEHIGFGLARCICGGGDHDISCPAALDNVGAPPK